MDDRPAVHARPVDPASSPSAAPRRSNKAPTKSCAPASPRTARSCARGWRSSTPRGRKSSASIATALLATERITTKNNCMPRDIIPIGGGRFLFGYNVQSGCAREISWTTSSPLYECRERTVPRAAARRARRPAVRGRFQEPLQVLQGHRLHEVLASSGRTSSWSSGSGKSVTDIKTFKWLCEDGALDVSRQPLRSRIRRSRRSTNSSGSAPTANCIAHGLHPHISIEDRVFVECVGGDLTIKVEDNTETGEGIYSEPVEQADQTLDDAEIYYAIVGNLILLKIRPYQEKAFRYFVFNEKLKEVRRIDAIEDACVLLPDDHGIIFARGYYLQSGEFKTVRDRDLARCFSTSASLRRTARTRSSPSTSARAATTSCSPTTSSRAPWRRRSSAAAFRFSRTARWRSSAARRAAAEAPRRADLADALRRRIVAARGAADELSLQDRQSRRWSRAMAECQQVLTLLGKDDTYAGLYLDLVKQTGAMLDSYFWLDRAEAGELRAPLAEIKEAAAAALAEFDKVAAIKRSTAAEAQRVDRQGAGQLLDALATELFERSAHSSRGSRSCARLRGELISLKELRYIDLPLVEQTEREVAAAAETLAQRTVEFLLQPEALVPFRERVDALQAAVPALAKGHRSAKAGGGDRPARRRSWICSSRRSAI